MSGELFDERQVEEALRRLCVITDWPQTLNRPTSLGKDGIDWCAEAPLFDVWAAMEAVLDDDRVRQANQSATEWLMGVLLERPAK